MYNKKEPTSWDIHFIEIAELISQKSKDPSTKVGVVVVGEDNEILSTGFNGFPRQVDEINYPERWVRPEKYKWVVHAEANAVANAARVGVSLKNSTLYINYNNAPCSSCTGIIAQAGIKRIITPLDPFTGVGKGNYYDVDDVTVDLLSESKIEIYTVNYYKNTK